MIRFVTGTDTGVGKTVASAILAWTARAGGKRVSYVKPVQTGLEPGAPGSDADFVAAVADVEVIELLRFDEPLAPAAAAERAGRPIDFDALAEDVLGRDGDWDLQVVEGAGGLLVPITATHTMADLAARLGADLVVVARPSLGTLNHTALTLEAAESRGLPVVGLVVCGWPARPGVTETTNLERLRAMAPVLALVPTIEGLSVEDGMAEPLRDALAQSAIAATGI